MKKLIFAVLIATLLLTACNGKNPPATDETSADTTDTVDTTDAVDTTDIADTTNTDDKILWNLGDVTVTEADGKICVFMGDELISNGEIEELYPYEYLGETRIFAKIPWEYSGYAFYTIDEKGISEGAILGETFTIHDGYIVTESRVFDLDKNKVFGFDEPLTSMNITVDEDCILINGIDDKERETIYVYSKSGDLAYQPNFEIDGDKITETTVTTVYGEYGGKLAKILTRSIADLPSFGEYKMYMFDYVSTNFIKDGVAAKSFESSMDEDTIGGCYYINLGMVYNKNLEVISDIKFSLFKPLTDGRFIAMNRALSEDEEQNVYIFDGDSNMLFEGNNGYEILHAGADYILAVDEIDRVVLLTPEFEQLCVFFEKTASHYFHSGLSGRYFKDGQLGYYFIFEDTFDRDEQRGNHSYEYYYIPETGESGCIDNGYADYAYAKPVLYLYPTEETEVSVTFEHPERLTTVYPKYNDGWRVTAFSDGTLMDKIGRSYYALYWEEKSESGYYEFSDGFCVSSDDSARFLEEKLDKIGFTELEANEFIIYWLPILEQNEYNLIRFELTEEREASNALIISPKPDSLLRMAMHVKGLTSPVEIDEQPLPEFERTGFTAVEWGGCVH